ncbi:MAG: fused MFS/spermidine synthase [Thaumarchaeota archaeon]|nr:fused MFS/spermidine synthase [Nitrososphaerota archaeon]
MKGINGETKLLLAFGISGLAALSHEVVWTRLMVLIFGSTVYAVSTILTAFMAGLALGSYYIGKKIASIKNLYALFGFVELGIGIYGIAFPQILPYMQYPYFILYKVLGGSFVLFQATQVLIYLVLLLLPTFLMGATFPILSKIVVTDLDSSGKKIGFLYSSNSIGSMMGPVISGFFLIPVVGIRYTALVAGILNIALGLAFLFSSKNNKKALAAIPIALLVVSSGYVAYQNPLRTINFYYIPIFEDLGEVEEFLQAQQTVFYREGLYSTVEVMKSGGTLSLKIDGRVDASTSLRDMSTQHLLAYLPFLLHKNPEKILNIGLGGGFTIGALKNLNASLDVVEIDEAVVESNEKIFKAYNNDALNNDKMHLYVTDARNFLFTTDSKWDIIISEPSNPVTSSVNHLFTKEFFVLAKEHLKEGGILAQWFPNDGSISEREYKIILKTLVSEFPYVSIWDVSYEKRLSNTLMIASLKPESTTVASFPNKAVENDMIEIGINSPQELNARLVCNPDGSKKFAADAQTMNLDDLPIIEFLVPRNYFGEGTRLTEMCTNVN